MKLVAVHVAPKGSVIEVAGKNGSGKSTLLNAIKAAIGGGKMPEQPIRKGEKGSVIRVKLGDEKPTLIVTRRLNATEEGGYTTTLHLEGPNGERYAKPQTMLDALYGALTFDPFQFVRMEPDEQLETLRQFVPGIDFDAINAANRGDFQRRTETNRQIKQLKAQLDALTIPGDPRAQRVDESALVAELERAGEHNTELERRRARRAAALDEMARLKNSIAADEEEIKALETRIAGLRTRIQESALKSEELERKLATAEALPEPIDTAQVKEAIAQARETNRSIEERERAIARREELKQQLAAAEAQSLAYTEAIEARETEKAEKVAAAKLPVEGLGFADDGVLFNGLPFKQASTAEQLKVSFAITAALSPELKIAGVRDAALLDEDTRRQVEQLAEEYGVQAWLEVIHPSTDTAIVLEDGQVKGADNAAA